MPPRAPDTLLAPYRVLDLTDVKGHLCGRILADLGADVVKVEPPAGDAARSTPPFVDDMPGPDRGLTWLAYNTGKRGVALDLQAPDGRALFENLVRRADFVIESFKPAYLSGLGLGYERLRELKQDVILTSITPFGQTGPLKDDEASDLVLMAMGGFMSEHGYADSTPLRMSVDQAHYQACVYGASAMLAAHYSRVVTGEGQHIDVSIQECMVPMADPPVQSWVEDGLEGTNRIGPAIRRMGAPLRLVWPAKDGFAVWRLFTGAATGRGTHKIIDWAEEDGLDTGLKEVRWDEIDMRHITDEQMEAWNRVFANFFAAHTKEELVEGSLKRNMMIYAVQDMKDILANRHLRDRGFAEEVEHADLGRPLTYPGVPWKIEGASLPRRRPAPRLGEHNGEVYGEGWPVKEHSGLRGNGRVLARDGQSKPTRLLEGLKVLDFSWMVAGPAVTKFLADHGATVVKVETSSKPDIMRYFTPYRDNVVGLNRSTVWIAMNTGKYSLGLNMRRSGAKDLALRLAAWADVIFDNYVPGTMGHWGLSYEAFREVNDGVIMMSMSSMGATGPFKNYHGLGYHLQAFAGFNSVTGFPDREPFGSVPYTDFVAPPFGVAALLAALDYRRRTGKGVHIDVSQVEAAMQLLAMPLMDQAANGRTAERRGNYHPDAAPHNAYPCQGDDRWCVIAVFTEEQWRAVRRVMGDPAWAAEDRFATQEGRQACLEEMDGLIAEWTRQLAAEEVMARLQAAGVAAGTVNDGRGLVEDPQLTARGFFQKVRHGEIGESLGRRAPVVYSDATNMGERGAPLLGQDTEYICTQVLGLTDEEWLGLLESGTLEAGTQG